jgi:hypothetical protein
MLTAPPDSSVPPRTGPRKEGSRKELPMSAENAPLLTASRNPARAASAPDSAWAWMMRRDVGMPDSRAALRFEQRGHQGDGHDERHRWAADIAGAVVAERVVAQGGHSGRMDGKGDTVTDMAVQQ